MTNPLVLMGAVVVVVLVMAKLQNDKLRKLVTKVPYNNVLPRTITAVVLTAQVSELVRVVEHVDFVHLVAALMLLGILLATRHGTEGENLH